MEIGTPVVETRDIDGVVPYWRNPRAIPDSAVAAVRDSIERYGYQQPIIVDADSVIITGHTRYAALRQLGVEQVPVIVADLDSDKAREYRVMDNRTSEFSTWDTDALVQELREFETDLIDEYFPDIDLGLGDIEQADRVTAEQIEEADREVKDMGEAPRRETRTVTCPECYHEFELRAD